MQNKQALTNGDSMRYDLVVTGALTAANAYAFSPMHCYLAETKLGSPPKTNRKLQYGALICRAVRRNITFQLDNAQSVILASPPPCTEPPPGRFSRLFDWVYGYVMKAIVWASSKESLKRQAELGRKAGEIIKAKLGDRRLEMMSLDLLATAPAAQGHGYAGRLVDAVLTVADERSRAIWLFSTEAGVDIYKSRGFVMVGEMSIGDDNPNWTEAPIIVPLMVREAKRGAQ